MDYSSLLLRHLTNCDTPRKKAIFQRLYDHSGRHQSPLAEAFAHTFFPDSTGTTERLAVDLRY